MNRIICCNIITVIYINQTINNIITSLKCFNSSNIIKTNLIIVINNNNNGNKVVHFNRTFRVKTPTINFMILNNNFISLKIIKTCLMLWIYFNKEVSHLINNEFNLKHLIKSEVHNLINNKESNSTLNNSNNNKDNTKTHKILNKQWWILRW